MTYIDNPTSVYAEQFGAVGDGISDDSAAINAALFAVGPNGIVQLQQRPYAIGSSVELSHGETLSGASQSGSVFGSDVGPGASLKWIGAAGETMLKFGAKNGVPSPKETFGGGIRNVQVSGEYSAATLLRIAACGNARFENLKLTKPNQTAGKCLLATANTSASGLDNTIRNSVFSNINMFAYGSATCFHNVSNGTEGGATGCMLDMMMASFGYGGGNGNGFYLSSMDDCSWRNTFAVRAGGQGVAIYMDGNATHGKVFAGNIFMMVHTSGGSPIFADGPHAKNNKFYGVSGVDEAPIFYNTNGAPAIVAEYLGTGS